MTSWNSLTSTVRDAQRTLRDQTCSSLVTSIVPGLSGSSTVHPFFDRTAAFTSSAPVKDRPTAVSTPTKVTDSPARTDTGVQVPGSRRHDSVVSGKDSAPAELTMDGPESAEGFWWLRRYDALINSAPLRAPTSAATTTACRSFPGNELTTPTVPFPHRVSDIPAWTAAVPRCFRSSCTAPGNATAATTVGCMTELIIATDGSALGNPGPTGWAWYADQTNWRSGGQAQGTNNIGELQAIRLALVDSGTRPLLIIADSRYAIDCLTRFSHAWERNGWVTSAGKPVANQELIKEIRSLMRGRQIRFDWTRGHAGHHLNDRVDVLAREAATRARSGSNGPHGPGISV